MSTRPTVERVKEAIFSSLYGKTDNARVLDLFAGSGQMGIEALSRGANFCDFVELNRQAAAVVVSNLKATRLDSMARVHIMEAKTYIMQVKQKYNLVFMDPPYGADTINNMLMLLTQYDLLCDDAIVVAESDDVDKVDEDIKGLEFLKKARYGRVVVRYYRKKGE